MRKDNCRGRGFGKYLPDSLICSYTEPEVHHPLKSLLRYSIFFVPSSILFRFAGLEFYG